MDFFVFPSPGKLLSAPVLYGSQPLPSVDGPVSSSSLSSSPSSSLRTRREQQVPSPRPTAGPSSSYAPPGCSSSSSSPGRIFSPLRDLLVRPSSSRLLNSPTTRSLQRHFFLPGVSPSLSPTSRKQKGLLERRSADTSSSSSFSRKRDGQGKGAVLRGESWPTSLQVDGVTGCGGGEAHVPPVSSSSPQREGSSPPLRGQAGDKERRFVSTTEKQVDGSLSCSSSHGGGSLSVQAASSSSSSLLAQSRRRSSLPHGNPNKVWGLGLAREKAEGGDGSAEPHHHLPLLAGGGGGGGRQSREDGRSREKQAGQQEQTCGRTGEEGECRVGHEASIVNEDGKAHALISNKAWRSRPMLESSTPSRHRSISDSFLLSPSSGVSSSARHFLGELVGAATASRGWRRREPDTHSKRLVSAFVPNISSSSASPRNFRSRGDRLYRREEEESSQGPDQLGCLSADRVSQSLTVSPSSFSFSPTDAGRGQVEEEEGPNGVLDAHEGKDLLERRKEVSVSLSQGHGGRERRSLETDDTRDDDFRSSAVGEQPEAMSHRGEERTGGGSEGDFEEERKRRRRTRGGDVGSSSERDSRSPGHSPGKGEGTCRQVRRSRASEERNTEDDSSSTLGVAHDISERRDPVGSRPSSTSFFPTRRYAESKSSLGSRGDSQQHREDVRRREGGEGRSDESKERNESGERGRTSSRRSSFVGSERGTSDERKRRHQRSLREKMKKTEEDLNEDIPCPQEEAPTEGRPRTELPSCAQAKHVRRLHEDKTSATSYQHAPLLRPGTRLVSQEERISLHGIERPTSALHENADEIFLSSAPASSPPTQILQTEEEQLKESGGEALRGIAEHRDLGISSKTMPSAGKEASGERDEDSLHAFQSTGEVARLTSRGGERREEQKGGRDSELRERSRRSSFEKRSFPGGGGEQEESEREESADRWHGSNISDASSLDEYLTRKDNLLLSPSSPHFTSRKKHLSSVRESTSEETASRDLSSKALAPPPSTESLQTTQEEQRRPSSPSFLQSAVEDRRASPDVLLDEAKNREETARERECAHASQEEGEGLKISFSSTSLHAGNEERRGSAEHFPSDRCELPGRDGVGGRERGNSLEDPGAGFYDAYDGADGFDDTMGMNEELPEEEGGGDEGRGGGGGRDTQQKTREGDEKISGWREDRELKRRGDAEAEDGEDDDEQEKGAQENKNEHSSSTALSSDQISTETPSSSSSLPPACFSSSSSSCFQLALPPPPPPPPPTGSAPPTCSTPTRSFSPSLLNVHQPPEETPMKSPLCVVSSVQRGIQTSPPSSPEYPHGSRHTTKGEGVSRRSRRKNGVFSAEKKGGGLDHKRRPTAAVRLPIMTIGSRLVEHRLVTGHDEDEEASSPDDFALGVFDTKKNHKKKKRPTTKTTTAPRHQTASSSSLLMMTGREEDGGDWGGREGDLDEGHQQEEEEDDNKQRRYPRRKRLPPLKSWLGEYAKYGYSTKDGTWGLVGVQRCVNQNALKTVACDVTVDGVLSLFIAGKKQQKRRQELLRNGKLLELAVDEREKLKQRSLNQQSPRKALQVGGGRGRRGDGHEREEGGEDVSARRSKSHGEDAGVTGAPEHVESQLLALGDKGEAGGGEEEGEKERPSSAERRRRRRSRRKDRRGDKGEEGRREGEGKKKRRRTEDTKVVDAEEAKKKKRQEVGNKDQEEEEEKKKKKGRRRSRVIDESEGEEREGSRGKEENVGGRGVTLNGMKDQGRSRGAEVPALRRSEEEEDAKNRVDRQESPQTHRAVDLAHTDDRADEGSADTNRKKKKKGEKDLTRGGGREDKAPHDLEGAEEEEERVLQVEQAEERENVGPPPAQQDLTSITYEEEKDGTRRVFRYKAITLPEEWVWMYANPEGTLQTALVSRCEGSHSVLLRIAYGEKKPLVDSGPYLHYGVVTSGKGLAVRIRENDAEEQRELLDEGGLFFIPHHTKWSLTNQDDEDKKDIEVYLTFWSI